ncbi:FecR domain-containing protein [Mucilaginibacter sp. CSA2-8R]|uniref:FecR family protein n=1 Tax=Mucilaginibacter sp. CSA2-8R TaxID=3141542 RepID=UPI00315CE98F
MLKLAEKWLNNTITPAERNEFDQWYNSFDDTVHEINSNEGEADFRERIKKQIFSQANINQPGNKSAISLYSWLGLAAALLMFAAAGTYFLLNKKSAPAYYTQTIKHDLLPGRNKAILILAGGHTITLNDVSTGQIATEGAVAISKAGDGKVVYNSAGTITPQNSNAVAYNTLSTPRGGQYTLTLSDGTKVWLNAASSIKFPTVFQGSSREVEITGEAYFEVTHNPARPFRVITNNQKVEVLGTHFDVNAYTDEPDIKTTLLQGRIKVTTKNQNATLNPGQQTQVNTEVSGAAITVNTLQNANEAIAWKNGFFEFNQAGVESVMRQISRWYDVKVTYNGKIPDKTFSGTIARNVNASQVLEILSYSGLHFKIEDKKIIITP